jgi:nucleotide-binding universal stress UspA family protein
MDIKHVLVPVDFSPPSTVAVNHGVSLARKFGAKLTLLHVIEPAIALTYTFPTESEKAEEARFERAERMLAAMLGPEDQDDLDLRISVAIGEIESEIIAAIHETQADIVVMGTHGRGLLGRCLTGSVTQALLRKVDVPILTVCHVGRPLAFKHILFATDISHPPVEDFQFVLEFAKAVDAGIIAAHVIDKRPPVTYETPQVAAVFDTERGRVLEETRMALKSMETTAREKGIAFQPVIAQGTPAEAIVRIADEHEVDFIVLAIRKKGRLERALAGTTAERVVREAHVPVLSVPADGGGYEVHPIPDAGTQTDSARTRSA